MGQVASVHAALYSASCLSSRWSRRWRTCMTRVFVFFFWITARLQAEGWSTSVLVLARTIAAGVTTLEGAEAIVKGR